MKLREADTENVVIEFTKDEYHKLFNIAQCVYEEYDSLDSGILELEKKEVLEFKEGDRKSVV